MGNHEFYHRRCFYYYTPSPSSGIVFDESLERDMRGCGWTTTGRGEEEETRLNRRENLMRIKVEHGDRAEIRVHVSRIA